MSNLGWLFYKDYFRGLDYADLENEKNEHIIQSKVKNLMTQTVTLDEDEMLGNTHFRATTTYPGLILGSGNAHELPDVKAQAILGFSFDYTSGLPIISGSSVKGVLRSAFKHVEYIQELLDDSKVDVKALEAEIFDNGDIFFDAVVVASGGSTLLGDDYITPHGDALKNPIPLRFIKVMPNVTFRFDFGLSPGLISKSKKAKLFQNILSDLGLGAKTNVGYGKFDNFKKEQTEEERREEERALAQSLKEKKEREEKAKREAKEAKEKQKEEGLNALLDCKTLPEGFKLLKDSFGKKPKPSSEEREIIEKFKKKFKKLSKGDIKTFSKYGV